MKNNIKEKLKYFKLKDSYRNIINKEILFVLCELLSIKYKPFFTNAHLSTLINLECLNNGYKEIILWNEKRRFWLLGNAWKIIEGKYMKRLNISTF